MQHTQHTQEQEGGQEGSGKRLKKEHHCAPGNTSESSCLNEDLIRKVAKIMNRIRIKGTKRGKKKGPRGRHKTKRQEGSQRGHKYTPIDLKQPCSKIHGEICENLERVEECKAEACLLFKDDIFKGLTSEEKEEAKESFIPMMDEDMVKGKVKKKKVKKEDGVTIIKPEAIVDDESWLSTELITRSCEDDMDAYKEYVFMGAEPRDFSDCKVSPLCRFNHKKHMDNGETKLGFVFNTDPHDEDGEHWISMFMDLKGHNLPGEPAIYYFDSYGRKPIDEIQELIDKTRGTCEETGKPMRYFYNDHPFQKGGAQCGMYAIHFLKEMVKGTSFEDYLNLKPCSELMIQKRYEYFMNPNDLCM
jgi:hypothetical protein